MANLDFYYGVMNNGKSAEILMSMHSLEANGHQLVAAKPSVDSKGEDTITSDIGYSRPVDILIDPDDDLRERVRELMSRRAITADILFIDEAQFLTPAHVDQALQIAKLDDIEVRAYGLRIDFQGNAFPGSARLLTINDHAFERKIRCRCRKANARFHLRAINGSYVFEGDQVAIEQDEVTYESLCGTCYLTEKAKSLAV
jgi:thymidine kinase